MQRTARGKKGKVKDGFYVCTIKQNTANVILERKNKVIQRRVKVTDDVEIRSRRER